MFTISEVVSQDVLDVVAEETVAVSEPDLFGYAAKQNNKADGSMYVILYVILGVLAMAAVIGLGLGGKL